MKLEAITRIIKTRETVEFTLRFLKLCTVLSFFCLVTVYLFDKEAKSVMHSVVVVASTYVTSQCFESRKVGYKTAVALSFINDFVSLDLAYDKFSQYSFMFVLIAHQLFIQSCIFNYYPRHYSNLIIVVRTSIWISCAYKYSPCTGSIPTEMPCCFVCLIILQIFLVDVLEKKTNNEIKTRLELESQVNFLKAAFHEVMYGVLVLDSELKCKFKNKSYEDLFKFEDFLDIYFNSNTCTVNIQKFLESSQNKASVGKFFVKDVKISCYASKFEIEDEKFVVLTFNRIIITPDATGDNEVGIANILQELSHDLKTPLNTIINEQREALEILNTDDEVCSHLLKSFNTSYVLLSFIQDIIDFSNLNLDLLMVNPTFFDVKHLIEECCEYIKHSFTKNCKFSIESNVSKLIYFDKNKLKQIIIGIFYTLFSSCPSGEIKLVLVKCTNDLKFLFLVTSEKQTFSLMTTALETLKFRMTQEIVSKLSGSPLKITKSPEISQFSVELTIKTEWESLIDSEIPNEGSAIVPPVQSINSIIFEYIDVLIVDDIEINCEILKKLLQGLSEHCKCQGPHDRKYTVHSVTSGLDAIQLIQLMNQEKRGYRIVFMDCQMPELDGWDTSKILNQLFEEKSIFSLPYIIAYSAYDAGNDVRSYLRAGMSDHLSKPCLREDLCSKVQLWLAKPIRRI